MSNEQLFNPRFTAYSAASNRSELAQIEFDSVRWPGGKMAGFMLWVSSMWHKWSRETGEKPEWGSSWSDRQHKLFDRWLLDQTS